jgi:hypothetical protein
VYKAAVKRVRAASVYTVYKSSAMRFALFYAVRRIFVLLDRATPKKVAATDANRTQTQSRELEEGFSDDAQSTEAEAVIWLPPRDSNPDMLIQSQLSCR